MKKLSEIKYQQDFADPGWKRLLYNPRAVVSVIKDTELLVQHPMMQHEL